MNAPRLTRTIALGLLLGSTLAGCQWLGMGGADHAKQTDPAQPQSPDAAVAKSTHPVVNVTPAAGEETAPADAGAEGMQGSAEALARKTQSHVQNMEPLLNKHGGAPAAASSSDPSNPSAPSSVHWLDANDDRFSLMPSSDSSSESAPSSVPTPEIKSATPPAADPASVSKATPATANQVAIVTEKKPISPTGSPSALLAHGQSVGPMQASAVVAPSAIAPPISSDALEQKLAQRVKDNPRDVAAHLDQQLLWFVRDESVPQLAALSPLPTEDRELTSTILDGLSNFRSALRADQNMLLSKKIRPLLDMSDRLSSQAELTIPTITLCKRVDGFGVYEPIDPPRFPAGKEHPVIVYCEVENFSSQLNDKHLWETKLSQEVALYFDTEAGMEVWRDKRKMIVDQSRNRRHDFFVVKMFKLPANLTIGRYLLKVSIVDEQVRRIAEATVPVLLVAE